MDNDIYKLDYFYDLPQDLIAKYPLKERTMSKLLCLDKSDYRIVNFPDIVKKIDRNDLLVINETKVFQARLELNKKTGGRVEILIVEKINKFTPGSAIPIVNEKIIKKYDAAIILPWNITKHLYKKFLHKRKIPYTSVDKIVKKLK